MRDSLWLAPIMFTSESGALWGEPEDVPSFAICAHTHIFAWNL